MRTLTTVGLVLIGLGLVGLVVGHFGYTTHKTVLDVGPLHATAAEDHQIRIPEIAGVAALIAGVGLVFAAQIRR